MATQPVLRHIAGVFLCAAAILAQTAPTAFDAATIKRNDSGSGERHVQNQTGRLVIENQTLRTILALAYGLKPQQIIGPDWIDTQTYDITGVTDATAGYEQKLRMLQPLLADRLQLTSHNAMRPLPVFVLTAAKGGIKAKPVVAERSEGSSRTREGIHLTGSLTVEALAENLAYFTDRPVLDQSGLDGSYAFDLWWTPDNAASDTTPPAHPALPTALEDQAGLKLEARTEAMPVLIIDSVQRVPRDW